MHIYFSIPIRKPYYNSNAFCNTFPSTKSKLDENLRGVSEHN